MTDKTRNILGAIGLALGLVALMLILTLTALHGVGTDDGLYYALQARANVLPAAGISDGDLKTLDAALARYLAGDTDALLPVNAATGERAVLEMSVDGAVRPAFNERELTHLDDCQRLFALLRKVRGRLIPWAVLLIAGGVYLLGYNRRIIRRIAWLAPLLLLIPLGAFALWAATDFDAAFTFFHRLLFTNDLWLLDPRTDLLIRICPESMFMGMGLRVGLWALASLAGVPAWMTALTFIMPKNDRDEDNKWNDNRTTRRAVAQRQKTFDFGAKR